MMDVKVKPLEWEAICAADGVQGEDDCEWHAQPHGCNLPWPYAIDWIGGNRFVIESAFDHDTKMQATSLAEAKAAAQADYEARILSALSPQQED